MATANEIILAVMQEVQAVGKKDRNQAQGFNFRGIDAVMNAVGPALRKAGGFIAPNLISYERSTVTAKNGGLLQIVQVLVEYKVYGSEGDPISATVTAEAFDSGDKATAKAMSVAYRTALLQLLCLPTDEPDPDTYSYEVVASVEDDMKVIEVADLIQMAATKDELRALWGKNANILDRTVETSTGKQSLKQLFMARQAEVN